MSEMKMFGLSTKTLVIVAVVVIAAVVIGAALQARSPWVQKIPIVGAPLAGA